MSRTASPIPRPAGTPPEVEMHIATVPTCPITCPNCGSFCGEPLRNHNKDAKGRPEHVCSACRESYIVVSIKPLKGRKRL